MDSPESTTDENRSHTVSINPHRTVAATGKTSAAPAVDRHLGFDRGIRSWKKFGHYRRIASLKEYVLVSQDEPLIEVFRPNAAGHWALEEEARTDQTVIVHGATIEVDSIYAQ